MHSLSVMVCFLYLIWSFGEPPGHMRSSRPYGTYLTVTHCWHTHNIFPTQLCPL